MSSGLVRSVPVYYCRQLGLGLDEVVTSGMSCGYEDKRAAVNYLDMPRELLELSPVGWVSRRSWPLSQIE